MLTLTPPGVKAFGRFHLLRRIGAGGMGEVFLSRVASPSGAPQVCVVKKMLPHLANDSGFVARFLDEAKVVVHLRHPGIARVLEMGAVDGEYFIAMEYVKGKTLGRISSRLHEQSARLPLPLTLLVAQRMCEALAYAHKAVGPSGRPLHVVHRDISPSNALVSYSGRVKIIDFGAAHSAIKMSRTAPRVVIGNLAYMSPEQARKKPVDGRADVYSLGVLLWELIAGRLPFPAMNPEERWRRAAYPSFSPLSEVEPSVPPEVDALVMRALNPDAAKRWPSADALSGALDAALHSLLGPTASEAQLASLMTSLFARDAEQDQAMVEEALAARLPADPSARDAREEPTVAVDPRILAQESRGARPSPPRPMPPPRPAAVPAAVNEPTSSNHATTRPASGSRSWTQAALLFAAAFGVGALLAVAAILALRPR